jgi:hypothetical protein
MPLVGRVFSAVHGFVEPLPVNDSPEFLPKCSSSLSSGLN